MDTITETTQTEKVAQTQAEGRNVSRGSWPKNRKKCVKVLKNVQKVVSKAESELKKQREHATRLEKELVQLSSELVQAKVR